MTQQDHKPPHPLRDETDDDEGVYDLDIDEPNEDPEGLMNEALAALDEDEDPVKEKGVGISRSASSDEALVEELKELRERSLRTLADYENYRRRSERERDELRKYAGSEILREFLTIMDNLERALAATGSLEDLTSGVEMIHNQMIDLLKRNGVEEVPAEGEPFDPMVHEAVARVEDPGVDQPVVVHEMQRGYRVHDRLLRPSIVRVAVPPEEGGESESSE